MRWPDVWLLGLVLLALHAGNAYARKCGPEVLHFTLEPSGDADPIVFGGGYDEGGNLRLNAGNVGEGSVLVHGRRIAD